MSKQAYEILSVNSADLAEHLSLDKQVVQEGQPFLFHRYAGPYHTDYGLRWMFAGTLKNGTKFTCFLPDNKTREEQLQKLQENKHYLLVKESWKDFDDIVKSVYKFKAIKSW